MSQTKAKPKIIRTCLKGVLSLSRTNLFIRIPQWAEIVAKIMSPDQGAGHVNPVRGWKGPSSQQPERGVAEIAAYYKLQGHRSNNISGDNLMAET